MRVAELHLSDRNPRTISAGRSENLKRSLREDPEFLRARPLLVNSYPGRENIVIAGNMRLRAAQDLGWDEVPALVVSVPPEIEAQWNLKDNNQWGDYVEEQLSEILADLAGRGVELDLLGFGRDEVERLLARASAVASGDDDRFDPTPPTVARAQPGDLLLLGSHRVVCGDTRDPATWRLLMTDSALADAVWTDPPYGVDLRTEDGTAAMAGDRPAEIGVLLEHALPHCDRWLRPGAPIYMAGPHARMALVFVQEWARVGWHLAQALVWVKNGFVPGRADYHYQHEAIYYGWKPGAAHVWLGALDQPTVFDDEPDLGRLKREELVALVKEMRAARATDVIREDKTQHNDLHPTMKPTGLIRQMLGNSTRRGDLILEPFAGSGSTIVAAEAMGRRVAAIELEPRFCDVILRRWLELSPANEARLVRGDRMELLGVSD